MNGLEINTNYGLGNGLFGESYAGDAIGVFSSDVPKNDANAFIAVFNTRLQGANERELRQVTLPLSTLGGSFIVDWGDGSKDSTTVHTYVSPGIYTVKIRALAIYLNFSYKAYSPKLIEVKQWGAFVFGVGENNFYGCSNVVFTHTKDAIGRVRLSGSLQSTFNGCVKITGIIGLSELDTSAITSFAFLFSGSSIFNQDLSKWNTSLVNNMAYCFNGCLNFNSKLTNWDTALVTTMNRMFGFAYLFNQSVSSFDTALVTDMNRMFDNAYAFNQSVSSFNTALVNNMSSMFQGATNFNQSVSSFNTALVNNMSSMFLSATNFNQSVSSFDTALVTNMNSMFLSATNFNQSVSNFNTALVTNMSSMFLSATNFNQDIGMWNVSTVTNFVNFMAGKTNLNYSAVNYDSILNGWTNRSLNPSLSISFGTIKHTAGATQSKALLTRTNSTVSVSNAVDNGSGLVRITSAAHGRTTGEKIFISGILGTTEANGGWIVTVISATELDLQGSTFTNTYTSGGTLRIGYGWTITDGGI